MTYAHFTTDGYVVFIEDGETTTLPAAEGDTPAHARLAAFLDAGGEIADTPPPAPPMTGAELMAYRAERKREIDILAEAERLKYITDGAGQAMTYGLKADEAAAFLAAANPDPADYPLLSAEIGITAPTLAEVAEIVADRWATWHMIGASIEAARLSAKRAIDAAADEAEVRAVTPVWPG